MTQLSVRTVQPVEAAAVDTVSCLPRAHVTRLDTGEMILVPVLDSKTNASRVPGAALAVQPVTSENVSWRDFGAVDGPSDHWHTLDVGDEHTSLTHIHTQNPRRVPGFVVVVVKKFNEIIDDFHVFSEMHLLPHENQQPFFGGRRFSENKCQFALLYVRYTSLTITISHDNNNNHRTSKQESKSWRSDGPPSCFGWVITRVGPRQNPQYTFGHFGGEAVGCYQFHNTQQ